MTREEIKEQIENECKNCKKSIICFMCVKDQLIEARLTIVAKQESIENFILGEKEKD